MHPRRDVVKTAQTTMRPATMSGILIPRLPAPSTKLITSRCGQLAATDDPVCWPMRTQAIRQRRSRWVRLPIFLRLLLLGWVGLLSLLSVIASTTNLVPACMAQTTAEMCPVTPGFRVVAGVGQAPTPTPQQRVLPPTQVFPAEPPAIDHFLTLALPYALQAHLALGWQTSVILAQWGIEHDWSVPDGTGYNWGNTTYAPECPLVRVPVATQRAAQFCFAATGQAGLDEYIYTARLPFYAKVTAAVSQGAEAVAEALGRSPWASGHYEVSHGQPGSALLALMRQYQLFLFDVAQ